MFGRQQLRNQAARCLPNIAESRQLMHIQLGFCRKKSAPGVLRLSVVVLSQFNLGKGHAHSPRTFFALKMTRNISKKAYLVVFGHFEAVLGRKKVC